MNEQPSRFNASPAEIDAFLRENFAEDVLLNFYRAVGDEVLDEALTHGRQHRGVMETRNCKHVYLAGMADVMDEMWDYRYYPAQLPKLETYDRPFNLKPSLHPENSTHHPTNSPLPSPKLPIKVTIREVPGGWDALAEDSDRARPIASAITYTALQAKLASLSATYQITVMNPESTADPLAPAPEPEFTPCPKDSPHQPHRYIGPKGRALLLLCEGIGLGTAKTEPAPEPQDTPCYRTKTHEPHDWLVGRRKAHCPGHPKETP